MKSIAGLLVCPRCGEATGVALDTTLKETFDMGEVYADSEPCDNCKAELEEFYQIMEEGGIAFYCKGCNREGVIRMNEQTREGLLNIRRKHLSGDDWETARLGVEFDDCNWHSPGEDQNERN